MAHTRRIAISLEIDQPYPNHQEVFAGVLEYANERGDWLCLIDEHPGYRADTRGPHYRPYDGVIARANPQTQRRLEKLGVPLVNTHYQTSRPGLAGVYSDPEACGRLAAEHLIDRGFRRLSVLLDREHVHSAEIVQGFVRCAQERGVPCTEEFFPEHTYLDPAYWLSLEKFLIDWLERLEPPVGLFIELAGTARLLTQLGRANGFHIPQDIAVLSRLNVKSVLEVSPQISSIDDNVTRVGYEAARLLDRLMSGEPVPDQPVLVPPRGIAARESTDYFAVEDEVVAQALRFISARLADPLRVDQVADAIAVSTRSLQKRFSEALGRGVSEEIRRLRLETAKRMLAEPDRQIGRVARLTGFGSPDLMNQVFRRELGMTPSAYRKTLAGERGAQ
ncbi:MAG: substrate-binding domain-containing protein [Phycisphaeraceae bacterium]